MGIEYTLYNDDTETKVALSKGPWWLLREAPELLEGPILNLVDELAAEWGSRRHDNVDYIAWVALHIHNFVRTGVYGVPEELSQAPVQRVLCIGDNTDDYSREAYPLVGTRGRFHIESEVLAHFPVEDLIAVRECI